MSTKTVFFLILLGYLFLGFAQEKKEALPSDTLLKVAEASITTQDVLSMALENPSYREESILVLRTLLMERLLALETRRLGIFVSEKEKDTVVQKEKELLEKRISVDLGSDHTLEQYLKSQKLTLKDFTLMTREKVTKQLQVGKVIRYLQKQEDRIEVLYIEFLSLKQGEEIREKLLKGASFSEMARQYSKHLASQQAGGKLPILSHAELGDLATTIFALKLDELSPVLEYNKKYLLFKVLKFYPKDARPFGEINDEIYKDLEENGVAAFEIDQWLVVTLKRYQPQMKHPLLQSIPFLEEISKESPEKEQKKK
ncbi:MAG: peptidyl-prolyl cis-trans isomerase [Planctomycetota bacterium]